MNLIKLFRITNGSPVPVLSPPPFLCGGGMGRGACLNRIDGGASRCKPFEYVATQANMPFAFDSQTMSRIRSVARLSAADQTAAVYRRNHGPEVAHLSDADLTAAIVGAQAHADAFGIRAGKLRARFTMLDLPCAGVLGRPDGACRADGTGGDRGYPVWRCRRDVETGGGASRAAGYGVVVGWRLSDLLMMR